MSCNREVGDALKVKLKEKVEKLNLKELDKKIFPFKLTKENLAAEIQKLDNKLIIDALGSFKKESCSIRNEGYGKRGGGVVAWFLYIICFINEPATELESALLAYPECTDVFNVATTPTVTTPTVTTHTVATPTVTTHTVATPTKSIHDMSDKEFNAHANLGGRRKRKSRKKTRPKTRKTKRKSRKRKSRKRKRKRKRHEIKKVKEEERKSKR